jgi:lysophospholipid acyltransferase (LPLAT)-like uncharacterized protein
MARAFAGWLAAAYVLLLRLTCRVVFVDDPRPALRAAGRRYAYAFLHAHQVATVVAAERGTGALVSRSADGELLVPSLRVRGVVPFRGSTRDGARDKGGREALAALEAHVREGRPAYFAVDGPRGPRGVVHRGVAELALATGAAILPAVAVASRRRVLGTWDGLQVPWPFSRLTLAFGPPLEPDPDSKVTCAAVASRLAELEMRHERSPSD